MDPNKNYSKGIFQSLQIEFFKFFKYGVETWTLQV